MTWQLQINKESDFRAYLSTLDCLSWRAQLIAKRLLDIVGAILGLVLLSPLLALLALLIRLESSGPVIYKQKRLGQYGRVFTMYKLRSMRGGAPLERNADGSTRVVDSDPRVTRLGRFMRRIGLDELPQLYNVIKGDMSLIGPRPDKDFHLQYYKDGDYRKLAMRPGITSLAQVSGRNEIPWKDRMALDIEYIERFSLLLDAQIVWRTIKMVWHGIGVNNPPDSSVMTSVTSSYSRPEYQVDKMCNVLSATDAMMLAEVVMAVIESQSQELMSRLRESLVQAVLGDVDGFLNILTGIELTPSVWSQATSVLDRQAGFVGPRLEDRPSVGTVTAG